MIDWWAIRKQSVIGVVSVAVRHIENEDVAEARETLLRLIVSLEGEK